MRTSSAIAFALCTLPALLFAQTPIRDFPQQMVFARHTFFDFGPPFDFYEVIQVTDNGDNTRVERILVTPPGDACFQRPTIETKDAELHQSIKDLLSAKDPCSIPEKELKKEQKRCKHCLTYSGANITMSLSCGTTKRRIRMDILDRDIFGTSPNTPQHTSWTMSVFSKLDQALGPGVWDKPVFSVDTAPKPPSSTTSAILQSLAKGDFDDLFDSKKRLSEYYHDAQATNYPSVVEIISASPPAPAEAALPIYPPIAKAAHVEGKVTVRFAISLTGTVADISLVDGPRMFETTIKDTLSQWHFPESAEPQQGDAIFRFQLNCHQP